MFSHIMIGSNDIARSKKFYDALFAAMGAQPGTEDARGRLAYSHNGGRFMVSKPIDGKPATTLNGGTIGFLMSDAKQAEAWHKAGVANGGTSIEDPPSKFYLANRARAQWKRDPDTTINVNLDLRQLILDSCKWRRRSSSMSLRRNRFRRTAAESLACGGLAGSYP